MTITQLVSRRQKIWYCFCISHIVSWGKPLCCMFLGVNLMWKVPESSPEEINFRFYLKLHSLCLLMYNFCRLLPLIKSLEVIKKFLIQTKPLTWYFSHFSFNYRIIQIKPWATEATVIFLAYRCDCLNL